MTSRSEAVPSAARELADFGFARVRDVAFDAVQKLWRRRQAEGLTQKEIAEALDRDPAWVSRRLKAPGNWTFRTFGELVQSLRGEAEITVFALEDPSTDLSNHDAYDDYIPPKGFTATFGIPSSSITSLKADTDARFPAQDLLGSSGLNRWRVVE